jgi:Predicted ATPase (AAA+ superfamily)
MENIMERKEYLDRLIGFRDKQIIKIITGIRRCGKSTMMEIFQNYLCDNGVLPEQIIALNFEDYSNDYLLEPKILHDYILNRLHSDKTTYVFLDEIQNVKNFQKVVDSLFLRKNIDLYLTGSNAYMLSGELATLLSGRYVEIEMLPLSFKEYVLSTGNTNELERKYTDYIENSSFPYTLQLDGNKKQIYDYLNGIYSTVVLKDVIGRTRIADNMILESIVRFVFDNIGNQLSTKSISDFMTSSGRKIDVKTVEKYIKALMASYIIYQAKRYNVKGKLYLKTLEKYYMVDIGLRYMMLGNKSGDFGHILENVIYLELLRRGYQVYVGKVDEHEVDFVAMNKSGITYFQVALTVRDKSTFDREITPLQKISDHYPKYILTLDNDPEADYDGIKQINALKWLMDY